MNNIIYVILSGLTEFLNSTDLKECHNEDSAMETFDFFFEDLLGVETETWLTDCPLPCSQTLFDVSLHQYHINNWPRPVVSKSGESAVLFSLRYEWLNVQEEVETLMYDTTNFLAQAGGNLGLFLGFSCLSLLLSLIRSIENILNLY
jgi:hypothetical protein